MTDSNQTLAKLRQELLKVRLEIRSGKEKNSNAHKKIKKQIAQALTKGETK